MEKLLSILEENCPGVDFESEKSLIDGGIIDSIDLVSIISDIEDEFDITIEMEQVVPENFNSIEAIWKMIESLGK